MKRCGTEPNRRTRGDDDRERHTGRRSVAHSGLVGGVGRVVVIVLFLSCNQVAQVRLHGRHVRLLLGVSELRNGDGCQNADDHNDDQQLDQREAVLVRAG